MDMCWPTGRPKMESGLGNLNRYLTAPSQQNPVDVGRQRDKCSKYSIRNLHGNIVRNNSSFFEFKFLKDVRFQDLDTSLLCVLDDRIRQLLHGIHFGSRVQLQSSNFQLGENLVCFIRVASIIVGFCSIFAGNFKQKFCATAVDPQISLNQDDKGII